MGFLLRSLLNTGTGLRLALLSFFPLWLERINELTNTFKRSLLVVVESQNVDSQGCLHEGVSPIFCQQVEVTISVYCILKKRKKKNNNNNSGEQGFVKVDFGV